jgi:ubiquinol-cytochrome c reductase cytochrome c subunit
MVCERAAAFVQRPCFNPAWLVSLALAAIISHTALAASAEKGRAAYIAHGCWQCHGFAGQGGITGPELASHPAPMEAFAAFVRTTNGAMPPYSETILSNDDLTDIHAYLESIPKPPDYKTIPLLSDVRQ